MNQMSLGLRLLLSLCLWLAMAPAPVEAQGLDSSAPPIQEGPAVPEHTIEEQPVERPPGAPTSQDDIYPPPPPTENEAQAPTTDSGESPAPSDEATANSASPAVDAPDQQEESRSADSTESISDGTPDSSTGQSATETSPAASSDEGPNEQTGDGAAEAEPVAAADSLQEQASQEQVSQETASQEAATATSPTPPVPPSPLLFDGDYLATVDRLRRALRAHPLSAETRFGLGQALFGLGEVDEAIDAYRQVLAQQPDSIPVRLHLATALMAKRRWKEAQKELRTILAEDNSVVTAHHTLAAVRYSQGDVRGAIESYRAALELAPDSIETHYHLAVVLRLAGRTKEAAVEFQAAAEAGHPKAQYFLGAAYAAGAGVTKDLPMAIRWWMPAVEQGVPEARDALSRLRKAALKSKATKTSAFTKKAFETYRKDLWYAFPELTPNGAEETVGIALLQAFHVDEAISTLIREATALGELSERYLAALYEQGLPTYLEPYDPRILQYFEMAAADGAPQARLALARIHALGLGVSADRGKALTILKGLPTAYAEQFLKDLADHPAGTPPHTEPSSDQATADQPATEQTPTDKTSPD